MNKYMRALQRFAGDETGVTLIEYALVCFLIAVTSIISVGAVGTNTNALYTTVCSSVSTAVSSVVAGTVGC